MSWTGHDESILGDILDVLTTTGRPWNGYGFCRDSGLYCYEWLSYEFGKGSVVE